ncbi:MAG: hypothetical protein GXO85_04375 [Chlorobi bacterium]|nr:hypothetical protein [Chlorobiota bacterium]
MPTFDETHYRSKMLGYTLQWEELLDPCSDHYKEYYKVVDEDCSKISPYYWYSGDPIHEKGWLNIWDYDQRTMINTGPFQLIKNKPVDIVVAYTVGEAEIPLKSLKVAKVYARNVQFYFRNNAFETDIINFTADKPEQVFNFRLEQNYPNPFNPSTIIG